MLVLAPTEERCKATTRVALILGASVSIDRAASPDGAGGLAVRSTLSKPVHLDGLDRFVVDACAGPTVDVGIPANVATDGAVEVVAVGKSDRSAQAGRSRDRPKVAACGAARRATSV